MQAAAVGTNCSNGTCSGTTAYSFSLSYAPNSNILSANDSANQNWNYSYDQLNRLACASVSSNTACAFPPTGTPTYTYVYDRFGNRLQQNSPAGGIYTSSLTFTGNATTNNNRMDGYCYDSAGNLLDAGACPSSGPHQYVYDAENRLISSNYGASTYAYNAEGRRIAKTTGGVTMTYTYDRDGHLFETYGQTNSLMENYVAGRHLGTYDWNSNDTGTVYHYTHADWLGTERARIDVSGNVCETITSLPFGDGMTTSGSCSDTSNMHFTGKERDSESGLDNFGARYDASNFGRFMSPDWSPRPTPVPYASLGNPQSLNLYAYAANNPLNRTDPNGHCWKWIQGLCNAFQKVYYGVVSDYGFVTHAQVTEIRKNETAERREFLTKANVVTPDKNGNTIDWSRASDKQVNKTFQSLQTEGNWAAFAAFTFAHNKDTILRNPDLASIRQMSTEDIIKSLQPGGSQPMVVKPDGTIMNGNTRLFVLAEERGVDINNIDLRPEIYVRPSLDAWEEVEPPHSPTEKPPDNQ